MSLTHLSLFSGIGGLDIAAEMAGIKTVGQCEWADFQTKILEKHWPDVPRWRDIRTLTADSFYERTGLRTVDVISGGFPCQPFSVAGKRGGEDDDRYLWPEMLRVIREIRPTWVIGENVPGIVNLALDTVLSDLEGEGYSAQAFIIPACGVDAPHRRERCCILAYAVDRGGAVWWNRKLSDADADEGKGNDHGRGAQTAVSGEWREDESGTAGMDDGLSESVYRADSDTAVERMEGCETQQIYRGGVLQTSVNGTLGSHSPWLNWPDEPGICRVVDGVPNRVDRIKSLGNAVVPQQFYIFFKLIADIEGSK
jgi:DNA (cytosine-5)-methyltransferase 1